MAGNIDSYVALSQNNTCVKAVIFQPYDSDAGNYEFWDKAGQIVGNLMELKIISINFLPYSELPDDDDDDDDDGGISIRRPDWETLTRILPHLRHKVTLSLSGDGYDGEIEEIQGLARAIHDHPMISDLTFHSADFTFANLGPWCSVMATLPSLNSLQFGLREPETEEEGDLLNVEPLKELLRTPALQCLIFNDFYFINELCYAIASALEEESSIRLIIFDYGCFFPDGGRAIIANALKRNSSVTSVQFLDDFDEPFCNALAAVLLCNSTLQNLTLKLPEGSSATWLSPTFLSLAMNTTLKSLSVSIVDKLDKLGAAISSGLATNSTLEALILDDILPSGDDGAVSARNALSLLRTNSTLKSLTVSFTQTQKGSYVSAFRLEAVRMMENTCLENLTIKESSGSDIKVEELLTLISALQLNTTLKTLDFHSSCFENGYFSVDEVNQLVSILKKNYGLERLVPDIPCADDGTVKAILRLNAAGRRYLIKDGSSISKGVDVLSAVSDEIDCVFLHLLENPSLCDRRAAAATTGRRRPSANLHESFSTLVCR
jgi:hypothetical protein